MTDYFLAPLSLSSVELRLSQALIDELAGDYPEVAASVRTLMETRARAVFARITELPESQLIEELGVEIDVIAGDEKVLIETAVLSCEGFPVSACHLSLVPVDRSPLRGTVRFERG